MLYLDTKYISLVSGRLEKFKKQNTTYNFRCPYCGDSQKNKNRARGYFFQKKGSYIYKCHNCGVGRTLSNFLKDHDQGLYKEYVLESYREGATGKGTKIPLPEFKFEKPSFKKNIFSDLEKVSDLNKSHVARRFLEARKLPPELFYFCPKFKTWTNKHKQVFKDTRYDESRIIIPLRDKDGTFGYQGRSIYPQSQIRYITVVLDENKTKLYGLDKVNENETVYITEGPFDSHFLRNAIAMCGSDVNDSNVPYTDRVWVFDNEPRSRQIVDKITSAIKNGDKVVIFPGNIKEKDLNDMTLAGHDVQSMVESNTYQGLQATLKLTSWKKV
jgi:DNA-directed RNA polymerase subunit RPC12/RpoP|tara:strand:+ start:989 stop:1972 length:984 start_codon:yes stop_codon:yes gene_type:complete